MPIAVIALDFDPILRYGDIAVRWQTVAVGIVVLTAIVLATALARRAGLRADDLLFVAVAIVPGAVIGGRVGYVLAHLDFYVARPEAILDPSQGSLTLGLAVAGGALTGAVVARLFGAPIGRWLHVLTVPVLVVLGLGKLVMVLAGSGQGAPSDLSWATTFLGDGPWGSLAPEIPAHPAQVYEALVVAAVLVVLGILAAARALRPGDGRTFFAAVALWSLGRVAVGSVWRDAQVLGPLRVEQLIGIGVAAASFVGLAMLVRRSRPVEPAVEEAEAGPDWPDPATRPPF